MNTLTPALPPHTTSGQLALLLASVLAFPALAQERQKLVENGTFDHEKGELHQWNIDYEWTGNKHYIGNKGRVSVVPGEGGKTKVVSFRPAGDAGAKMESIPLVFEEGYRYRCALDIKSPMYRVYFAGYKWQPGIRPHEAPELGELRLIYKSKATSGSSKDWETIRLELPGVELSAQAKSHLAHVRFVTLYIWMAKDGYVDNVHVERVPDETVKFK